MSTTVAGPSRMVAGMVKSVRELKVKSEPNSPTEHVLCLKLYRLEWYYQMILEELLGGIQKTLSTGVTTVTTDNFHAIIKHGKNYVDGIAQLTCHYDEDPRPELRLYLHGITMKGSTNVVKHASARGISVYIMKDIPNGVEIINVTNGSREVIKCNFLM